VTANVLTLNAGSSSLKFGLYTASSAPELRLVGQIDGLGAEPRLKAKDLSGEVIDERALGASVSNHTAALDIVLELVAERAGNAHVAAVGHRVVHGGIIFAAPTRLDDAVVAELGKLEPFAPLHQPANLAGVAAARAAHPDAVQVACFDTAFHRRHPWVDDVFALPISYYEKGVRRYGFHGLSYEYVAGALAEIAPMHHAGRVVIAHLGNGASMCALLAGRSVGSTMGFSALDGLPMGTRCGQLDPGVVLYLMQNEGLAADEISDLLYRRSGLLGLSGVSHDMRALQEAGTPEARRAIDYFVSRVRRELGAMTAVLGGLDALVFCGGIGENATTIRTEICQGMEWLGLHLDAARNEGGAQMISSDISRAQVYVIRTDEELVIARAAAAFVVTADSVAA
jgi:acetate kinase